MNKNVRLVPFVFFGKRIVLSNHSLNVLFLTNVMDKHVSLLVRNQHFKIRQANILYDLYRGAQFKQTPVLYNLY